MTVETEATLDHDTRFRAGLAELWEKSRDRHLRAIATVLHHLDGAVAGPAGPADDPVDAIDAAHRLAGTLGIFGLPDASDRARQIEEQLEVGSPADEAGVAALLRMARAIEQAIHTHDLLAT